MGVLKNYEKTIVFIFEEYLVNNKNLIFIFNNIANKRKHALKKCNILLFL